MEDKIPLLSLLENAEAYAKTNVDLLKLKAIDKSADVISTLVSKLILAILISLIVILGSIGLSLWIGELTGKSYYGFFILVAAYSIVALIFSIFKEKVIKIPVNNSIVSQLMKKTAA